MEKGRYGVSKDFDTAYWGFLGVGTTEVQARIRRIFLDGYDVLTYEDYKDDWIYEWNKDIPWVHEKPWIDNGTWEEPTPNDGYCNEGNLPGAYIVGNSLHYQEYEWYEALEDGELKDEALRNKAIMEGIIDDDDDKSSYKS
ncbi:hypothetical protein Tco_0951668 [Tanacetum coccineum]|uniref:Uncharacterized protein n=1 Tax=Tanacetum coccineum TaxID=301880 RepID=A0ABQ5DVJ8_9ASTR